MGQEYFEILKTELEKAYSLAQACRAKGFDPEKHVEVPIAKDVAARVEELVGPRGISGIIRELEHSGMPRTEAAFVVVEKIVKGEIIQGDQRTLIEQAVRTGVSILTEGVLVAPTEGISDVRINENPDGSSYVSVFFSGPIRSAGGTVAALSVALADYARKLAGVGDYRPTDKEVARYVEEVNVYEYRCHHLQYKPPDEHVEHIIKNCPVCIDGDPTEDAEVSVHRDLARIKSNRVRGGVPLVVCEGMAAKAPKVLKYAKKFGLEWDWLQNVIKVKKKEDKVEIKPDPTYLEGLVAGRPVFAYPMAKGGFRLRYGRSRTNGIMARNVHPATMILLDSFIANGTHMKVERPGKGCVVTVCDTIEPPVVKLMDGSVLKVHSIAQAEELKPRVSKILFLGDMLITFGDFLKTNHPLMPCGYCSEWWVQEAKAGGAEIPEGNFGAKEAFELSRKYSIPLHPDFTNHWGDISIEQLRILPSFLSKGELRMDSGEISGLSLPNSPEGKMVLEDLLVEHSVSQEGKIELGGDDAYSVLSVLGMLKGKEIGAPPQINDSLSVLENISELSGITIRNKAPTYIGGRMGRPEKAKERAMEGKTHILFPTASEKNRSIIKRYRGLKAREGEQSINAEVARYRCASCKALTFFSRCHSCGEEAKPERVCQKCGAVTTEKKHCDMPALFYDRRPVPLVDLFEKAREELGFTPSEVNGVKGLFSHRKVPERLEKGFLRAKHDIFVFKDGTCRFDATDTPITHFRISEIGQTPEGIKALGYTTDCKGAPITNANQVVALFQQDIVVSSHGMDYIARIAAFVDDSLVHIYGLPPFYNFRNREDLFGHLAVGLSPHTSAGVLCRIIGFTNANVGYGHPYFHTAKRRNCFSGETTIPILENGSWKMAKLKEFVEQNLGANALKDEAGTAEYSSVSGLQTLAFNPDSKKFEIAEITHISKHITQDHLLEIATKSGRKITVTKEHPFPNCGKKKMAMDAERLYVPAKISIPEKDLDSFDVSEYSEDVFARTKSKPFAGMNLKSLSKKSGMGYKTFTNYVYRNSYPLSLLKKLGLDNEEWEVAAKRDTVSIKRKISVDEDFLFLLGLYLAEGHTRRKAGSHYQVSFAASKKEMRNLIKTKINRVFGIKPNETSSSVTICSRLVYSFFEGLKVGAGAKKKRVPSFVLSLPERKIAAFLNGYFSGDGSSSLGSTLEVNCTSVSRELLEGFSFLLGRLGIIHSWSESDREINTGPIPEFYGHPVRLHSFKLRMYGKSAAEFIEKVGFALQKGEKAKAEAAEWASKSRAARREVEGDVFVDEIISKKIVQAKEDYTYSVTVAPHHTVVASGLVSHQCDGDEDSIMLLLDCLLNFSRSYLSDKRGGTMDAPLTLTPQIDPREVDDEVHCMEVVHEYPLEFYKAAERNAYPGDVKLPTVKDLLGKDEQYGDLLFTHDTATLNEGPMKTMYVELGSIPEKIAAEFELHAKLRPVDLRDTAERLILSHFIPDLYGNLRSFSRQNFRCSDCNLIYRRVPLAGKCTKCGGKLLLTINKGGIIKYLSISQNMVEKYALPAYLGQRLALLEKEIHSVFEDDKIKQTGLSDFM